MAIDLNTLKLFGYDPNNALLDNNNLTSTALNPNTGATVNPEQGFFGDLFSNKNLDTFGQVAGGAKNAFDLYSSIVNFGNAQDMFGIQKDAFLADRQNQANLTNRRLSDVQQGRVNNYNYQVAQGQTPGAPAPTSVADTIAQYGVTG